MMADAPTGRLAVETLTARRCRWPLPI